MIRELFALAGREPDDYVRLVPVNPFYRITRHGRGPDPSAARGGTGAAFGHTSVVPVQRGVRRRPATQPLPTRWAQAAS